MLSVAPVLVSASHGSIGWGPFQPREANSELVCSFWQFCVLHLCSFGHNHSRVRKGRKRRLGTRSRFEPQRQAVLTDLRSWMVLSMTRYGSRPPQSLI